MQLLDMSVYLKHNCWSEFIGSTIHYLNSSELKVQEKTRLLQRSMVMILLSRPTTNKVSLPSQYLQYLQPIEFNPSNPH